MSATTDLHSSKVKRLQSYLASDPHNPGLLADLADALLQDGQPAAAQAYVERALELNPGDGPARYRMAVIEHQLGKLSMARDRLQALLQEGVDEPAIRLELARVAERVNDFATPGDVNLVCGRWVH